MADDGWADQPYGDDFGDNTITGKNEESDEPSDGIDWGDMLRYRNIKEVTTLLNSGKMLRLIRELAAYHDAPPKNAIPKDDPEHAFICECSEMVLQLEMEKSKAFKFLRDHYAVRFSVRFSELAMFIPDGVTYAKVVKIIRNDMNLTDVIDDLDELVPSQLSAVIIAAASTTLGRDLEADELTAVLGAVDELEALELAKQTLLEYIQHRMPLVCPNLCAFLGTGIVSQIFAVASSITKIATMDPTELAKIGSNRAASATGVKIKTVGFLMNSDLVATHPPQLRPKALRLVSSAAVTLARIDDNRRASDSSQGLKQREDVKRKMIMWTDPVGLRGAANNTYERRTRKRERPMDGGQGR
ncbi:trans-splicing factor, putative [Bodo saltans]|uniref:Trans-splicing factor, putative n=1 Tax=Bodo saltans TaxID=75058 RepID=A0A0S4J686_BODSA|nr:trans-splicing factor, putative [Bodo saltans]|eukprot:CUG85177.1 trans-splicing factor, putative [Bodo saltans]